MGDPYYAPIFSATPETFAAHVRHLREHFRMIGPNDLEDLVESGFRPTEPSVLITFDDAYRDNIDLALPILRELGVPAAFFVPTGFLDRPRLTWWDHVSYVIKSTKIAKIVLDTPEPLALDLHALSQVDAIAAIVNAYLRSDPADEARSLAHLGERAEVTVDTEALGRSLFATWDQVRTLADAGMIVGSHTRDHLNLARQTEADQTAALVDSRRTLERELGREVATLAYPYGGPGDFTAATKRIAHEAGYRVAFSTTPTVNRPGTTDPFDVRRFFIGLAHTPVLFRARMGLAMAFGKSIL
jgi:peptidoglycan/xylan/chitin deacetylase (PgdA/CDA1 family)